MATESSKDHLQRLLALRGQVLAWIDPEEVDRLAFGDLATVAQALNLPPGRPADQDERCSMMLRAYLVGGAGALLHSYLAEAVNQTIIKVGTELASIPCTTEYIIQVATIESALSDQEKERQFPHQWGFDLDHLFENQRPWYKLLMIALVDPYQRHSQSLINALSTVVWNWRQSSAQSNDQSTQEVSRPDMKLLALVHAFRFLSNEKEAFISPENAAMIAEGIGATAKSSGRELRKHFTRYTMGINSKNERLGDGELHTVLSRYRKACKLLKTYPEALRKALAELESLTDR